ncbi:PREDICTED: codanin-1 [Nanorana parkeri]|uniref:codanin-1 n=1 Tax=Nanorana parkeri TaxID=125878 RepID=UPI000854F246|nr:PREDICTED: codanin-1 [Nanorana parkeri]
MAAVLELVLQERVTVDAVLRWLTGTTQESPVDFNLAPLHLLRKDFVPYLLNFLREQTSEVLSNGPSTPAKTPNSKAVSKAVSSSSQRTILEKRSSQPSGHRGSRVQLFAQTPNASGVSENCFASPNSTNSDSSFMSRSNLTNSSSRVCIQTSPNSSCSPISHHIEKRSAQKPVLGNFLVMTPEGQTARRTRKKNNSSGRHVPKDQSRRSTENEGQGENNTWSANKKQVCTNISSPPASNLNINNLEEFPPMGASCESASKSKPLRRINPTPLNDVNSKSRICFTSTPISTSNIDRSHPGMEAFTSVQEGVCAPDAGSLREEREILRKERSKLLQQTSSPVALDPITPTKQTYNRNSGVLSDMMTYADLGKVSCRKRLEILAKLYSSCITENLVPNIFLEFFFVLQLLTSRGPASTEDRDSELEITRGMKDAVESQHFQSVHNCVFFAVLVLDFQFTVISLLDKNTLKLLAENERIGTFFPPLQERLLEAHRTSTGKVSLLLPATLHSVSFQPETDNRSNFPSDRSFHIFKKQRDVFYELLREWEDCHEKADWDFERFLGNKIRAMMLNLSLASNHSHFARLFQKQLVQLCKGPNGGKVTAGVGDNPDQDLLNMLGSDNLNRLKQLQERFVAPQSVGGPCPPPSFPGYQEFFRDFILSAGNYQFNQHLMDSLCQEIQELDALSIVGYETTDGESDMDEQDEKIRFASILLTVRLLAKFLGFLTFLPYRTTESLTGELQETAVALRNQTLPMLDVLQLLRRSIQDHRTVLTVPWAVEYLSLVDGVAPYLQYYRKVFCCLLHLYRYKLIVADEKEMGLLNKLLILAVLGWLFQVPAVPEDMFFNNEAAQDGVSVGTVVTTRALDCVPLVDQQLLYSCCPYLGELRRLLISFVAGCGARNGGFIRKITPTAAEPLMPKPTLSQKKLQAELEQAFFHNQPPSLRRSVEFVAERIGSNCVKHIKATLVADLVKRAEVILKDKVSEDIAGHSKLLDSVCARLCEDGRQALQQGQEYCKRKAPEAVGVLLPEETSACVLRNAEDIAVSLAIEKACTWLSTNISALIRREVKATFNRMVKSHNITSSFVDNAAMKKECCDDCEHKVALPSRLISEIKEFLCISVGPRDCDEGLELTQLRNFLARLSQTLNCRKYTTVPAEHHLAKCTVELVSLLVSGQVPLVDFLSPELCNVAENQRKKEAVSQLLMSMLTIWKKDFVVPVPIQLIFSHKNMKYCMGVHTQEQWGTFAFLIQQLLELGLVQKGELEEHICRLQKYKWPLDLLSELDHLSLGSENHREPKDRTGILVPHTGAEIIAPS